MLSPFHNSQFSIPQIRGQELPARLAAVADDCLGALGLDGVGVEQVVGGGEALGRHAGLLSVLVAVHVAGAAVDWGIEAQLLVDDREAGRVVVDEVEHQRLVVLRQRGLVRAHLHIRHLGDGVNLLQGDEGGALVAVLPAAVVDPHGGGEGRERGLVVDVQRAHLDARTVPRCVMRAFGGVERMLW